MRPWRQERREDGGRTSSRGFTRKYFADTRVAEYQPAGRMKKSLERGSSWSRALGLAVTTRGQPCRDTGKSRPGYQTFPILSLVVDVTRRSRTCVTSQERTNKAVVRVVGGSCCRKRQTSSLPRLRGTRLPSRIIQYRAAPYVPNGGNEVAGARRSVGVDGSDKLIERRCSCLNYERYGLSTYMPGLTGPDLPHQILPPAFLLPVSYPG